MGIVYPKNQRGIILHPLSISNACRKHGYVALGCRSACSIVKQAVAHGLFLISCLAEIKHRGIIHDEEVTDDSQYGSSQFTVARWTASPYFYVPGFLTGLGLILLYHTADYPFGILLFLLLHHSQADKCFFARHSFLIKFHALVLLGISANITDSFGSTKFPGTMFNICSRNCFDFILLNINQTGYAGKRQKNQRTECLSEDRPPCLSAGEKNDPLSDRNASRTILLR